VAVAHLIVSILHIMGVAIGVGAATATDPLFLSSIRNRKLSSDQLVLLHNISRVVMAGLTLVVLSGIAHLWLHPTAIYNTGFLAKMTIVFIVAVNGMLFHFKVLPHLEEHVDERMNPKSLCEELPLMAATGALSGVSWYSALILAFLMPFEFPYLLLFSAYLTVVTGAIIVAYLALSHIIFTPQPEPEQVLEEERFPRAVKWWPAAMALIVFAVIATTLFQRAQV
jgi:hypothetical protein